MPNEIKKRDSAPAEEVPGYDVKIGREALSQIIIPQALREEFTFSIDYETGDLSIRKKENGEIVNNK